MAIFVTLLTIVMLLSLVSIVFGLTGRFFIFEALLTILFFLIAFKSLIGIGSGKRKKWAGLLVLFSLNLINLLVLYRAVGLNEIALLFTACILGFFISLAKSKSCCEVDEEEVVTTYESEKFVASKTGKKFHVADCAQAKRIKKQICFDSKEDAKKEGKTACKCVGE